MIAYLIRRLLYAVPVVLGVVLLTFALFFVVNTPQDMARRTLGPKAGPRAVEQWVAAHGYDKPRFFNGKESGLARLTDTLLFQKCARVLIFDLGRSDASDRDIAREIRQRMIPSLAISLPTFVLEMGVCVSIALLLSACRGTYLDRWGTVICVLMMSASTLFFIIAGQFIFARWLQLFPISGFDWRGSIHRFVLLPILVGVCAGVGASVRFYRTVMLEEIGREYVRTARAKGLAESRILFRHVLKNAMVPILTNAVMAIPFLFLGSLLLESFFSIPGLGSMTIDAIQAQDFAVIRSMTFIGALLYIAGLLLTDISYTLVDPRIRLQAGGDNRGAGSATIGSVLKTLAFTAVLFAFVYGVWIGADWLSHLHVRVPIVPAAGVVVLLAAVAFSLRRMSGDDLWRSAWVRLRQDRRAMASLAIIACFVLIALLDSVAWSDVDRLAADHSAVFTAPRSALDRLCEPLVARTEKTFSSPLASTLYVREVVEDNVAGKNVRRLSYPQLLAPRSHILGTDRTGRDVLYVTLKGVRTALLVGGLTTLIALPFAILFGMIAGYFGGWVDDLVVYLYTTLSSVPWVLLVATFMLVFGQGLMQLCIVMGLTNWVNLCRLLRGETLKLREREYVQAARAVGCDHSRILRLHILPNLTHLVLISVVLSFSGLVLAEAVLSYIGIGVGPEVFSWGSMINQARNELSRDPIVWWNLAAAFAALFALVLPVNLLADGLRDSLDTTFSTGK